MLYIPKTVLHNMFYCIILMLSMTLSTISQAKNLAIDPNNLFPKVTLETSMGVITVELDRLKAPITVDNFLTYVVSGEYNNTVFHRVINNFVVQGGGYDTNYTPKKVNDDIINEAGNGDKNDKYTIAMARQSKPHSANRQFFFNAADNKSLNPGSRWGYAVFGSIIEGQEIMDQMSIATTGFNNALGWSDVPVEKIILIKATLLPAED